MLCYLGFAGLCVFAMFVISRKNTLEPEPSTELSNKHDDALEQVLILPYLKPKKHTWMSNDFFDFVFRWRLYFRMIQWRGSKTKTTPTITNPCYRSLKTRSHSYLRINLQAFYEGCGIYYNFSNENKTQISGFRNNF